MRDSIHTLNQSVYSLPRELGQIPTYLDDIQKAILGVLPNSANHTVSPAPSAPSISGINNFENNNHLRAPNDITYYCVYPNPAVTQYGNLNVPAPSAPSISGINNFENNNHLRAPNDITYYCVYPNPAVNQYGNLNVPAPSAPSFPAPSAPSFTWSPNLG